MATEKQIEANRINAQASTGPRTDQGKAASRLNAVKHGMTAVVPGAGVGWDEVEKAEAGWRKEVNPVGFEQEALFEIMVSATQRARRCHIAFETMCVEFAERARTTWDRDRRHEADEIGAGLSRSPARAIAKLEDMPHGCDLLKNLWKGLLSSLTTHKIWTDSQRTLALDLLGVHKDLRDAVTPVDPAEGDVYQCRVDVVEAEITRLTDERQFAEMSDASNREMAEATLGVEFTKPAKLIDRYARNAERRQLWAMRELFKRKRSSSSKPAQPSAASQMLHASPFLALAAKIESLAAERGTTTARPLTTPVAPAVESTSESRPSHSGMNRQQRRAMAAQQRRA